jgi:hypothetical protein
MRFGTNPMGTTIRDRTGALSTRSVVASRTVFSVGGITSQNVRVKSNGVWEIAQKFAYVRGSSDDSSGTIVKLTCLRSSMVRSLSVSPHDAYDHALYLHLVCWCDDRRYGVIGRLQSDVTVLSVELFERDLRALQ